MGQNQSQEQQKSQQGGFLSILPPELNENIYTHVDAPTYTRGTSTSRDAKQFRNKLSFLNSLDHTAPDYDLVIKLIEENNLPAARKHFYTYLLEADVKDDDTSDEITEILNVLAQNMNNRKCVEFINSYPGLPKLLGQKYPGWDHILFKFSQEYDDSDDSEYGDDEETQQDEYEDVNRYTE